MMSNSALKGADGSNDDEESGLKEHIEDLYHDDVIEAIKEEKDKGSDATNKFRAKNKRPRNFNRIPRESDDLSEKEIDIKLEISKKAGLLKKPIKFDDVPARIDEEILPNPKLFDDYIDLNPVHRSVQVSGEFSEHEVNTERAEFLSQGMNHVEGGWPKDINPGESDQTMRFRKKIEKDDAYVHSVLALCQSMEQCIKQNNAVEIYEDYFDGGDETTECEKPDSKTLHVFRDPSTTYKRPVAGISWCPDGGSRIAIAYCNLEFQATHPDSPKESYVFHVEDPTVPDLKLSPPSYLVSVEYNPKDYNVIAGGCYNGQVCWWDVRKGGQPEATIGLDQSHVDPVYKTIWVNAKSGAEFFTASTDGTVKWWDVRKFSEPTEVLILDPCRDGNPDMEKAHGASCLEFEPSIPTKFMVGTDRGCVFSCNKKAKTRAEKMAAVYHAHFGPVYALQRNPCFPKNFLTVGDWCARIWSEDIKESSIMWTSSYTENLTDGCWSPTRPSVFFTTRMDGCLDCWDILYQQKAPLLSVKVSDDPLHCLRVHESGLLVATGCDAGNVALLQLTEGLASAHRNDKTAVTAMFERETRREKILEARNKEIRLKEKTKGILGIASSGAGSKSGGSGKSGGALTGFAISALKNAKERDREDTKRSEDDEDPIEKAEREFFEIVKKEQESRLEARKVKAGSES